MDNIYNISFSLEIELLKILLVFTSSFRIFRFSFTVARQNPIIWEKKIELIIIVEYILEQKKSLSVNIIIIYLDFVAASVDTTKRPGEMSPMSPCKHDDGGSFYYF